MTYLVASIVKGLKILFINAFNIVPIVNELLSIVQIYIHKEFFYCKFKMWVFLLFPEFWLHYCISDGISVPVNFFEFIIVVIRFCWLRNVTFLNYAWLWCKLRLCLRALSLKILLRLIFQWTVFIKTTLVYFLMPDFINKKLFEI